jgi:nucleotide-binding universal stress UspA family protein
MTLPKTILVATDFSDSAEQALDYAVALAGKLGASIHVVHAIGVPSLGVPELGLAVTGTMMESMLKAASSELDKLASRRASANIATLIRTGDARDVIDQTAKEIGADLVVMGTHGRRGVSRALLGSVAETVVRTAPCPVLTIRKRKDSAS